MNRCTVNSVRLVATMIFSCEVTFIWARATAVCVIVLLRGCQTLFTQRFTSAASRHLKTELVANQRDECKPCAIGLKWKTLLIR